MGGGWLLEESQFSSGTQECSCKWYQWVFEGGKGRKREGGRVERRQGGREKPASEQESRQACQVGGVRVDFSQTHYIRF